MNLVNLSLIIPAYNEASRLPFYLWAIHSYFSNLSSFSYEIIVVDDGSQDGLLTTLEREKAKWPELRFLCHRKNQGKGAAVRSGIFAAEGQLILYADADGATPIEEEGKLRQEIDRGADVAFGSRYMRDRTTVQQRTWHRDLKGQLFGFLVRKLFRLPIQDTQCGFKMFRREAGQRLFELSREQGYLFDLEVLALAHQLGYRIAEIPVSWKDVPGSKVRFLRDGWRMFRGLWSLKHSLSTTKM